MKIEETSLPGVVVITPRRFGDDRGYFAETWNKSTLMSAGLDFDFVQDNQSLSGQTGTVRGLHFQAPPRAQDKLVRVLQGSVFDVAVDIRNGSPTYGEWVGVELSSENGKQLLVPKGFAHGFATLQPNTLVFYKCSDTYAAETEGAIRFDDKDLAIDWGLGRQSPTLSDKDAEAPPFAEFASPFSYEGQ